MSAETAPITPPNSEKPVRHLHAVETADDHHSEIPAETEQILVGFSRETMRERDAIQAFIKSRDKLWDHGNGLKLEEAVRIAALRYDDTLDTPLTKYGPDPEEPKPAVDPHQSINSGNRGYDGLPLLEVGPISDDIVKKIAEEKEKAIKKTLRRYDDIPVFTDEYKKLRDKELADIEKYYTVPKAQKAVTITDLGEYTDKDGKTKSNTIKNRGLALEDELEAQNPAIEASYNARKAAIADGKSLDEAHALGVEAYDAAIKAMSIESGILEPETTAAGRREAAAIYAFKQKRDEYISPDLRNAKFDRGMALHRATTAYVETLEHTEHLGHSDPDSIFADGHHDAHQENSQPTEPTPAEQERKSLREKVRGVVGKIAVEGAVASDMGFVRYALRGIDPNMPTNIKDHLKEFSENRKARKAERRQAYWDKIEERAAELEALPNVMNRDLKNVSKQTRKTLRNATQQARKEGSETSIDTIIDISERRFAPSLDTMTSLGENAFKFASDLWDKDTSSLIINSGITGEDQQKRFLYLLYKRIGFKTVATLQDQQYTKLFKDRITEDYLNEMIKKGKIGEWLPLPIRDEIIKISQDAVKDLIKDVANKKVNLG